LAEELSSVNQYFIDNNWARDAFKDEAMSLIHGNKKVFSG
jgi:hypothetical protein